ncbi:MAG: hypothetical protein JNM68_05130, partial [Dinghuibacter sp.]|nr:hypothetical protein [Dinghuibacter sp.]
MIKYGASQGLPHPVVYRVFKEASGLLWFSTDNGICRYDGQRFTTLTSKNGFRSNYLFSMAQYNNKNIVATFGGGLQYFTPAGAEKDSLYYNELRYPLNITVFRNNLFVTDKNKNYYGIVNGRLHQYYNNGQAKFSYVSRFLVHENKLVAATKGLGIYNEEQNNFELVNHPELQQLSVYNAISIGAGGILLATNKGLYTYQPGNNKLTLRHPKPFSMNSGNLLQLANGNILAAYNTGEVFCFGNNFSEQKEMLSNVVVNDMLQDGNGATWICTYGQGVWKLPSQQAITCPVPNLLSPCMYLHPKTKTVSVLSFNGNTYTISGNQVKPGRSTLIQNEIAFGFAGQFTDTRGNSYLFTTGLLYHEQQKKVVYKNNKTITQVFEDSDGRYWVAQKPGLFYGKSFDRLTALPAFEQTIVRCITEDDKKNKYLGTDEGLFILR